MTRERLTLFDTTLRDGAQTQGVDFSVEDKNTIARSLDELGLDYIEEMFGIEQHLSLFTNRGSNGFRNICKIFRKRNIQRNIDLKIPTFSDKANRAGIGTEQSSEAGIIGGTSARALGHAEGRELCVLQRQWIGEESRIGRIRYMLYYAVAPSR